MEYTVDNIRLFGLYGLKYFSFATEGEAMYVDFTKNVLIGMILLFMGIMGMYLARIYDEAKGRPEYILKNTERK